jgi:hypothetical protein
VARRAVASCSVIRNSGARGLQPLKLLKLALRTATQKSQVVVECRFESAFLHDPSVRTCHNALLSTSGQN